ncbi:hypothetical protein [Aquimarina sp. 2201CG5-10]|uniref:hypothetical protein n=1 Tax=Aquimarina callyspongiae TaxID=3098150 RepID=UPI002AB3DFC3|nr:hypothetical protein [Aquimarina sp. 2201CG5-10]MDY8134110.1 hypothetical protein [Aquimarina sp. 2201CG5-10]
MKRVIVDYKKLNKNILNLLVEKFPDGYADRDIISFRNQYNEAIEAVEVKTLDTIYLVKISKRLADTMQSFEESGANTDVPTGVTKEQVGDIDDK